MAPNTPTSTISDDALFDALDLAHTGLENTRAAVQAGDLPRARTALAAYLRVRTSVPWSFDPHHMDLNTNCNLDAANDIVNGQFEEQTVPHTFPDGQVDWLYNPTRERDDLPVNNEWQWQLNRMSFWPNLGRAYWASGDETYARTFADHLRTWAQQCPRPEDSGNYATSAWRTIESGIRMRGSWPDAYHRFLRSPSFTDDDIVLYLGICIEHARHLRRHHRKGNNWLTMEMAGLYTVGAVFPELKDASAWRDYASETCYNELNGQFTPDGAQVELSPGYHWVSLGNILSVPLLANRVGRMRELPGDFLARAEKGFDYLLHLLTPDRSTPRTNDTPNTQDVAGIMQTAVELFPKRADFLWATTLGKEGAPPSRISCAFPYAGYYAMRSGWGEDATMLCFDAGPTGIAHIHQDKLNVMLWACGRELLLDTGGGPYEQSEWRRYGVDTHSHNTVLVGGQPQRRERGRATEPLNDVVWQSTPDFDFALGVYRDKYGDATPAVHTRRVLYVKPDLFLVADTLVPTDAQAHTYQARWHLKTPNTAEAAGTVVTSDKDQPNLAVVPLLADALNVQVISAQEEPELLGWWIRKRVQPRAVPAATVLHTRKGGGVQQFLTLLLPLKSGRPNPVADVHATAAKAAEVTLIDGRRLRCEADADPDGPLSVTETRADGTPGRRVQSR